MKFNKKFYTMALGTFVFGGLLASCTNDLNEPTYNDPNAGDVSLVHVPDVYAWSGDEDLGNNTRSFGTRSANPNQNEWTNRPSAITDAEREYVANWFEENPGLSNEAFDFTNFYVQHVYTRPGNKDGIWHRYDQNRPTNNPGSSAYWDEEFSDNGQMDKLQCGSSSSFLEDVNNFNATSGSIMLMENSSAKVWGYHSSWGTENGGYFQYFKAAEIDVPGVGKGYYVGLSYYAKKYDNGDKELGIQRLQYADDWIIKITKAEKNNGNNGSGSGTTPENPGSGPGNGNNNPGSGSGNGGSEVNPDEKCPDCDHPAHGDYCKECPEFEGCNNKYYHKGTNEVEVNLSINDVHSDQNGQKYENADLWIKLSIHVRKGTNVTVKMPLPGKYAIDSDDFAIFEQHPYFDDLYLGSYTKEYTVTGFNTVGLTIAYSDDDITVSTSNISQDLIDHLLEKNGDGINFEVWLYFQTETVDWIDGVKNNTVTGTLSENDYNEFQGLLNGSTITFTSDPHFYINAFNAVNKVVDDNGDEINHGDPFERDCLVTPTSGNFSRLPGTYPHLNGSWHNIIYSHNSEHKPYNPNDYLPASF